MNFIEEEILNKNSEKELVDKLYEYLKNWEGEKNKEIIFELGMKIIHKYPNNAYVLYCIGMCYGLGIGVEINSALSKEYILKSANMNCEYAQLEYACFLLQDNNKECILWLKKAIANENKLVKAKAILILGTIYEEGKVVSEDISEAIEYYEQALKLENEESLLYLGKLYFSGKMGENKKCLAFEKYSEYIKKHPNNAEVNYYMARCYQEGIGIEKDIYKAWDYFFKANRENNGKENPEFWKYFEKCIKEVCDDKFNKKIIEMNLMIDKISLIMIFIMRD